MDKETRNSYKNFSGFKRIKNALFYSLEGYSSAWKDEEAFRQVLLISIITIPLALFLGSSFSEKMLLVLPSVLCIIVELLNSALENTVDRISLETHPLSKKAKDMGSAAQMTAQLFLYLTWIIYITSVFFKFS